MRQSIEVEARETRALSDLFADAVMLIRQDAAEYAFTAVLGAVGGAVVVVLLSATAGPPGRALTLPAALLAALLTYAAACAAIRRVEEQLAPDALSAAAAVVTRLPAIVVPVLGPLGATFIALLVAGFIDRWIGATVATLAALAVIAAASMAVFKRALYIPALFTRSASAWDAAARAAEAHRAAGPALFVLQAAALLPAALVWLIAIGTDLSTMSAALATFVLVMTTPLCAAISTLIFDRVAPATKPTPVAAHRSTGT